MAYAEYDMDQPATLYLDYEPPEHAADGTLSEIIEASAGLRPRQFEIARIVTAHGSYCDFEIDQMTLWMSRVHINLVDEPLLL